MKKETALKMYEDYLKRCKADNLPAVTFNTWLAFQLNKKI